MNWPRLANSSKVLFSRFSVIAPAHQFKPVQSVSVKIAKSLLFHSFFNTGYGSFLFLLLKHQLYNFCDDVAFHLQYGECCQRRDGEHLVCVLCRAATQTVGVRVQGWRTVVQLHQRRAGGIRAPTHARGDGGVAVPTTQGEETNSGSARQHQGQNQNQSQNHVYCQVGLTLTSNVFCCSYKSKGRKEIS